MLCLFVCLFNGLIDFFFCFLLLLLLFSSSPNSKFQADFDAEVSRAQAALDKAHRKLQVASTEKRANDRHADILFSPSDIAYTL